MASIQVYLPVELVELIAEYIHGWRDLAALARSSRPLYTVLIPILYGRAAATTRRDVLFWAADNNQLHTLQLALDAGIDPNCEWLSNFRDALIMRYRGEYNEAMNLSIDLFFWSAVHIAANKGYDGIIELLLDRGGDLNRIARCSLAVSAGTPLFLAIYNDHLSTTELLLRKGASVHLAWIEPPHVCTNGMTALAAACLYGSLSVAQLIIEKGFQKDTNVLDSGGRTPLMYSFIHERWSCFDWLLSLGADINAGRSPDGRDSMLIHACDTGRFGDACRLIDLGIDTNVHRDRSTPLHLCCLWPQSRSWYLKHDGESFGLTLMRKLIEKGADLEARNSRFRPSDLGMTPLGLAAQANNKAAAELLLSKGANLHAPQQDGGSVLILACMNLFKLLNLETVNLLLQHGADVNQLCPNYGTALEKAALLPSHTPEKLEVIQSLLDHGATPIIHGQFKSAFSAAFRTEDPEACEIIVEKYLATRVMDSDIELTLRLPAIFRAFLRAPNERCLRALMKLDQSHFIREDHSVVYEILRALQNMKTRRSPFKLKPVIPPLELVAELLDGGTPCDYTDHIGQTALTLALETLPSEQKCTPALVRKLLERGADPNQGVRRERTPLVMAIRRTAAEGQFECVQYLLNAGAKGIHKRFPGRGDNVFMLAIRDLLGSPKTIDLLLEHEPLKLHSKVPIEELIEMAFRYGKFHVVQALLRSDETVENLVRGDADRYLHVLLNELNLLKCDTYLEATVGNIDDMFACLDFLLKLGADLLSSDEEGQGWEKIKEIRTHHGESGSLDDPSYMIVRRGLAFYFTLMILGRPSVSSIPGDSEAVRVDPEKLSDHDGAATTLESLGIAHTESDSED